VTARSNATTGTFESAESGVSTAYTSSSFGGASEADGVTLYRGVGEGEDPLLHNGKKGAQLGPGTYWTTDKNLAEHYAGFDHELKPRTGVVYKTTVRREDFGNMKKYYGRTNGGTMKMHPDM